MQDEKSLEVRQELRTLGGSMKPRPEGGDANAALSRPGDHPVLPSSAGCIAADDRAAVAGSHRHLAGPVVIDPGHGMAAAAPLLLDEGITTYWLRHNGVKAVLTRNDSRTECPVEHRVKVANDWDLWDVLEKFLPAHAGPRIELSCGLAERGKDSIEIRLGHLTSREDIQLITDNYWKICVCESLAAVLAQYLAAQSGDVKETT